jgi:uncharacterized protein YjbI with pentapeptide repeats
MNLKINNENYKAFLKNEKLLVIDNDFLTANEVSDNSQIEFHEIKDKTILFSVDKIELPKLIIEIKNCEFERLFVTNSTVLEIKLITVEVSVLKDAKFQLFDTDIDNSKINSFWCYDCNLNGGLLFRKGSVIDKIICSDCNIGNSFAFLNSTSQSITIESSQLEDLRLDRTDHPDKNGKTTIDTINVFRTDIKKSFKVWEVIFKKISIYKITMHETSNQREVFENELRIHIPDEYKNSEEIEIKQSTLHCSTIIVLDNLKNLNSYDSTFRNFSINFWKINNFSFFNNKILEGIFLGRRNWSKIIDEFEFSNCSVGGQFSLANLTFTNKLLIKGSSFNYYPSFFFRNNILESCIVDFEFSNLANIVFQRVNFKYLSFKSIDLLGAKFKDCEWDVEKGFLFERFKVSDENKDNGLDLIDLKKIYSNLKSNFQDNRDYLKSGKFYISEQEIKRKISKKEKSWFEYVILSAHRFISSYGESMYKPFVWMILLGVVFSFIYLFSGFYAGDRLVHYQFAFDPHNFFQTLKDWLLSVVFSFKNIVPFTVNRNFFLVVDESLKYSQVLELFQKFVFIILIGSFTESFVRYLKK